MIAKCDFTPKRIYLPFNTLKVGAFFFTTASPTTISKRGAEHRKKHGLTQKDFYYTCRPAVVHGLSGYKVWRLD